MKPRFYEMGVNFPDGLEGKAAPYTSTVALETADEIPEPILKSINRFISLAYEAGKQGRPVEFIKPREYVSRRQNNVDK